MSETVDKGSLDAGSKTPSATERRLDKLKDEGVNAALERKAYEEFIKRAEANNGVVEYTHFKATRLPFVRIRVPFESPEMKDPRFDDDSSAHFIHVPSSPQDYAEFLVFEGKIHGYQPKPDTVLERGELIRVSFPSGTLQAVWDSEEYPTEYWKFIAIFTGSKKHLEKDVPWAGACVQWGKNDSFSLYSRAARYLPDMDRLLSERAARMKKPKEPKQ